MLVAKRGNYSRNSCFTCVQTSCSPNVALFGMLVGKPKSHLVPHQGGASLELPEFLSCHELSLPSVDSEVSPAVLLLRTRPSVVKESKRQKKRVVRMIECGRVDKIGKCLCVDARTESISFYTKHRIVPTTFSWTHQKHLLAHSHFAMPRRRSVLSYFLSSQAAKQNDASNGDHRRKWTIGYSFIA